MNDGQAKHNSQSMTGPSRREFLTRAGLMAGGLALLGLPSLPSRAAAAVDTRMYAGGKSALELDGQFMGFLQSAEGGFPFGEVLSIPTGPNQLVNKQLGAVKFREIAMQCEAPMPKLLHDWVAATLTMNPVRKNGALITTDLNMNEQSRLQFNDALITEFTIPPLDAASKDALYFTLKCLPAMAAVMGGKGSLQGTYGKKDKAPLSSNFRLTIPGLDCSKVTRIDALTVKQGVATAAIGDRRLQAKDPGTLEFPNLTLYVPEAQAGSFYGWFQDMVIKGNNGENNERPGTLEFFDPTLKNVLFAVNFSRLGIFGYQPEKLESASERVRLVKIEMYCEQITLTPPKV